MVCFLIMFQHLLNKNSISFGGIPDKYMGDCTNQFAVLDDRASAHALDNSSGSSQELFISYLQDNSAVYIIIFEVDVQNFNIVPLKLSSQ